MFYSNVGDKKTARLKLKTNLERICKYCNTSEQTFPFWVFNSHSLNYIFNFEVWHTDSAC